MGACQSSPLTATAKCDSAGSLNSGKTNRTGRTVVMGVSDSDNNVDLHIAASSPPTTHSSSYNFTAETVVAKQNASPIEESAIFEEELLKDDAAVKLKSQQFKNGRDIPRVDPA